MMSHIRTLWVVARIKSLPVMGSMGRRTCSQSAGDAPASGKRPLNENQTVPVPKAKDAPYIKYSPEDQHWFTSGHVEIQSGRLDQSKEIEPRPEVDPDSEPYNQIYEGNPDFGRFTGVEVVSDPGRWFWVERLLPNNATVPHLDPDAIQSPLPSGFVPPPKVAPDLPYFVPRTRNRLFPVYKRIEVQGPRVLTMVMHVEGDLWQFEEDLRGWLERKHQTKILSAVHEGNGTIKLKHDYVADVVDWLSRKGF